MAAGLYKTTIRSLPFVYRGKVRDSYAVGDDKLLIVTTDRLSAFDVVMSQAIPDKGRVLNAMSNFWFEKLFRRFFYHTNRRRTRNSRLRRHGTPFLVGRKGL